MKHNSIDTTAISNTTNCIVVVVVVIVINIDIDIDIDKYSDFPLVQSMMVAEKRRTLALTNEGAKQMRYPKSNTGWIKTLFVFEGRALGRIRLPWSVVMAWAVFWAVVYETYFRQRISENGTGGVPVGSNLRQNYVESMLELVISTTLGFLLVFRLNRSATRFWMARASWGIVVAKSRTMVGSILLHGSHNAHHRDQAIKWIATFSIASMNFTRGTTGGIDPETVEGLLTRDQLADVNGAAHSPLHSADRIRYHLSELFAPSFEFNTDWADGDGCNDYDDYDASRSTPPNNKKNNDSTYQYIAANHRHRAARAISISDFRSKQLISLENQLNVMIDEEGAMERIKGTPLPMVYVTHLRTWLMVFLLSQPYFWEQSLGYVTIPVVGLMAFALLGLEGAAAEVEAPFRRDRTNHLNMNSFCLTVLSNILQQMREDADRRMKTKSSGSSSRRMARGTD
uniref:Bestrophin homolog n=1 Tax=Pseudo-nitzschia australis TaxID=44445 RepID=A0A7S4ALE2_9STRA